MAVTRSNPLSGVVEAISSYVEKILSNISGMKVLVLDHELSGIIGVVYSQSRLLEHNVVLTLKLDQLRQNEEGMKHLKCIFLLRPLRGNIDLIRTELKVPKYGEYHVFFSNSLHLDLLKQLAQGDGMELVQQVQEVYCDYYAISSFLFSFNLRGSLAMTKHSAAFNRALEGCCSLLLSLKLNPNEIRYQARSQGALEFAEDLTFRIKQDRELFSFRNRGKTSILLLDRREDPVTPLLTQWTYQAMVHEMFFIHNNTVKLKRATDQGNELEQIVLSEATDPFFAEHYADNFGDLGEAIKALLESYQKMTHSKNDISTVEDMQKFVDSYPELKRFASNVSKHVAIMGELARLVETKNLLEVSQLEQQLACVDDHNSQLAQIREKLTSPEISTEDATRLLLLYAIRYEKHSQNEIKQLSSLLRETRKQQTQIVDAMLQYAGATKRSSDLFGDSSSLISKSLKKASRAIQGVSNVYTQHKPLLREVLDDLFNGNLKASRFPDVMRRQAATDEMQPPDTLIVFFLGGTTYEEAVAVRSFNESLPMSAGQKVKRKVILGGTCIHNSKTFLTEVGTLKG